MAGPKSEVFLIHSLSRVGHGFLCHFCQQELALSRGSGCSNRAEVAPVWLKLMDLSLAFRQQLHSRQVGKNDGFWPHHWVRAHWCCQWPVWWSLGRHSRSHWCFACTEGQKLPSSTVATKGVLLVARPSGMGDKSSCRAAATKDPQEKEHQREVLQHTLTVQGAPGSWELVWHTKKRLVIKLSISFGWRCLQLDSAKWSLAQMPHGSTLGSWLQREMGSEHQPTPTNVISEPPGWQTDHLAVERKKKAFFKKANNKPLAAWKSRGALGLR